MRFISSSLRFVRRIVLPITAEDRLLRASYLFILPAMIVYLTIIIYPTISTSWLSFFKWNGLTKYREWVGVTNFVRMFQDEVVLKSFIHNFIWIAGAVCIPLVLGLLLSVLMATRIRGRLLFRVIYFLPMIFPPVVTAIVWEWMYASSFGIVNNILRAIGLGQLAKAWLGLPETALLALIGVFAWVFYGFCVVILLGAIQNVDPALKEAARIDGANSVQVLFYVTLPSIRNEFEFMVIYTTITAMKMFHLPYIMTGGGPAYSTEVIATVMYRYAFVDNRMGYGSAIATVLMLVIVAAFQLSRIRSAKD